MQQLIAILITLLGLTIGPATVAVKAKCILPDGTITYEECQTDATEVHDKTPLPMPTVQAKAKSNKVLRLRESLRKNRERKDKLCQQLEERLQTLMHTMPKRHLTNALERQEQIRVGKATYQEFCQPR